MFQQRLQQFIAYASRHKKQLLLVLMGLVTYAGLLISFVELAEEVSEGQTKEFDEAVLLLINDSSNDLLDLIMPIATEVGGVFAVVIMTVAMVAFLLLRHRFASALTVLVSIVGSSLLIIVLKELFARDRPSLWEQLVVETSHSFPSGHSIASSALAFTLIYILWGTRWRYVAVVVAVIYILFVGFSRMYLGVHYPTDVVGGWLVSALWLGLAVTIIKYSPRIAGRDE